MARDLKSVAREFADDLVSILPDDLVAAALEAKGVPANDPVALRAYVIAEHRPKMIAAMNGENRTKTPGRLAVVGRKPRTDLEVVLLIAAFERGSREGLKPLAARAAAGAEFCLTENAVGKAFGKLTQGGAEYDALFYALIPIAQGWLATAARPLPDTAKTDVPSLRNDRPFSNTSRPNRAVRPN